MDKNVGALTVTGSTLSGEKYLCCNMLPDAQQNSSNQALLDAGAQFCTYRLPVVGHADKEISLFSHLGWDVLAMNVPVAYVIESFEAITGPLNALWWRRRARKGDIVIVSIALSIVDRQLHQ
jgi:hypothetical protein